MTTSTPLPDTPNERSETLPEAKANLLGLAGEIVGGLFGVQREGDGQEQEAERALGSGLWAIWIHHSAFRSFRLSTN